MDNSIFSHFDQDGNARMVDISDKTITSRFARARGEIHVQQKTLENISLGNIEKGDVLTVAKVAGILGAKRTSDLIPMCHPIPIDEIMVDLELDGERSVIIITSEVKCESKTGAEMEALTSVAIAALTVYDMIKSGDKEAVIQNIRLLEKRGGKSGDVVYEE